MSHLKRQTQFANNAVIIVDCLKSTDLQTARLLNEDLLDFQGGSETQGTLILHEKVSTRQELIAFLTGLIPACKDGLRPIIHFECHGDKVMGLGIGDEQERMPWSELVNLLSSINAATKNNTGVVMAACHGFYALTPLTIDHPCPFFFLIGSQEIVSAGVFGEKMKEFYKVLFRTGALEPAMAQLNDQFKQFLAEKFFATVWGHNLRNYGIGKGLRKRNEKLVTAGLNEARKLGKTPNVKAVRSAVKKLTPLTEEMFDVYANIFLHGQSGLDFYDILKWVKSTSAKQ